VIVGNSGRLVVDRVQVCRNGFKYLIKIHVHSKHCFYFQAKIYSLALDEAVFLKDPEDSDEFEKFLAHFDLTGKDNEISDMVSANPHLQLHYSQFVPDKVTHIEFWSRFYYRVQLIIDQEAKQLAKEKEIERKSPQKSSNNKEGNSSGNISPIGDPAGGKDSSNLLKRIYLYKSIL
jgi:hypothetical protein